MINNKPEEKKKISRYRTKSHHPNLKNFRGEECIDNIQKDNTEVSFSYSQGQRKTHGNISHDFLEWLSDNFTVPIAYDQQGKKLPKPYEQRSLRLSNGEVDVDLALVSMGFCINPKTGNADYTLLSNVQRRDVPNNEGSDSIEEKNLLTKGVYIRDNKRPYLVSEQLVYSGQIRPTSYAKNLYEKYEILTGDFTTSVNDVKNILEVGTLQWYNKTDIRQGELRVLADDITPCEE